MSTLFQINHEEFTIRAQRIIDELKVKQKSFSTYRFIELFRKQYETEYILWLTIYAYPTKRNAFKQVHKTIGTLLSKTSKAGRLNIKI